MRRAEDRETLSLDTPRRVASKGFLLAIGLLWIASALHAQEKRPAPAPRPDNYIDLRAKYAERLAREEKAREARRQQGGAFSEDPFEIAFNRWDRYWRDHLDAGARQPGKMADMSLHLRDYYLAGKRTGKGARATQSTALVCPSAGLGNWSPLGPSTYPAPILGKVTSVYIDPANPNVAYAGAAEGGLFKTANNGAYWTNLTDASRYPALGVASIAVDPTAPTVMYIATSNGSPGNGPYGFGLLKSTDGGTTWQETLDLASYLAPPNNQGTLGIGEGWFVSKVMLHPQDPSTVYALARHYVFRSQDAGATWQKVLEIIPPSTNPDGCSYPLVDIDILPGTSGVADSHVVVSTQRKAWLGEPYIPSCGPAKIFLSAAGGASNTFTEITSAVLGGTWVTGDPTNRIATAIQPGNNGGFFVAYQYMTDNQGNGPLVVKKYDLVNHTATQVGQVSTTINNPYWNNYKGLGAGYWNLEIEFSKLNPDTLYAAGTTAYRIDLAGGGFSPQNISAYWATDPNTCQPQAHTHGDIRALTVSRQGTQDVLVLGSDGGIHKAFLDPATAYTAVTANWHDMTGPGLAINEFFDVNGLQANPDLLVAGSQDNGTFEYANGVWTQRNNGDGWQGTMNQATGEYLGMTNFYPGPIKGLPGASFSPVSGPPDDIKGGSVVSDLNNAPIVYTGAGVKIYKSPDFGATWTALPQPPGGHDLNGDHPIRVIQVAPSNSQVLYVSRDHPTWGSNNSSGRLFRSSDGGSTWTDVGGGLDPWQALYWATVSDIAVDPDDANRVWVGINGYWATSNISTNGLNRVFYSGDGGGTWSDFTFNLPAFPVTSLIYQRGSTDGLYAATDVGVFHYNKPLGVWECFNNQLPVVPVTRLEPNYCRGTLRAATWGRGIWESDLPALPSEVVSASAVWSGVRYLANDLTVAAPATLKLTGTLNMSRGKRIIVQRGAMLDVNGGTITNPCGDMWLGIEVWGTAAARQTLAGAQGKLLVRNGARIENAIEAITTGKDVNGAFDFSYTGGIVQASDSFFYNNRRSAQFMYYHSMNGSHEADNLSYFKNCTFETNRLLNDPAILPYAHISLYEVTNVKILGCRFSNTGSFGVNDRGDGVRSSGATYTLDDLSSTASVFSGLTYGVRADFPAGAQKGVTIANSDFNGVRRGIEITNSAGSWIYGNNFNAVPNALTTNPADATWGVRMIGATNLALTGNTIAGASPSYQNDFGVILDSCGASVYNRVEGNTFKDLFTGIQALGGNGSGVNGVHFRCNVFQPAMAYQIAVGAGGTLADQGNVCAPGGTADNTFFAQATPPGSQISSAGAAFSYYASGTVPTNVSGPVSVTSCSAVSGECSGTGNGTNRRAAPATTVPGSGER